MSRVRPVRRVGSLTVLALLATSLALAVLVALLDNAGTHRLEEVRGSYSVMGTFASYIVVAGEGEGGAILLSMDSLVRHLDRELGFSGGGDVTRLNEAGGAALDSLSPHTVAVLGTAMEAALLTDSLFDPVLGALVEAWGFREAPAVPGDSALARAAALSGLDLLSITQDSLLLATGASLDLGAVAKGYAADAAYSLARERGALAALVEIGGEVRCGGSPSAGRVWTVAVRDPGEGEPLEVLRMDSGAVATSGSYEQWFESGGVRYCHLLDPRTGMPEVDVTSVTVVSGRTDMADALATAIAIGGAQTAESLPDSVCSLVIVLREGGNGETTEWRRE